MTPNINDTTNGTEQHVKGTELHTTTKRRSALELLEVKAAKPQLSLIPPTALRQEARAMENGLKYGRCSYRKPGIITANGMADAMMRHIQDWLEGEDDAPDSGVHHLAHVRAGAGILLDLIERDILTDDRDI